MGYYPAFIDLKEKECLVVGGGQVAERKVRALLGAGARVTVVSPAVTKGLQRLNAQGRIRQLSRDYQSGDLRNAFLVVACTSFRQVNQEVAKEAKKRRMLVNVVDDPRWCNFIVPSVARRGDLTIAISTGGKSPALARKIREELQAKFGPEYGAMLKLLGAVRRKLLTEGRSSANNKTMLTRLVNAPLLKSIEGGKRKEVERLLLEILGKGYSLKELLGNKK